MRSLSIGSTGMLAQQMNVEVISNNIANMTTTGFKKQRAEFQDLLYQDIRAPGSTSSDTGTVVPTGIQLGSGVKSAGVYRINEQGALLNTQNSYDLAINGDGFFEVELPTGDTGYTRNGSFQVTEAGELVTVDGYRLLGPGAIPAEARSVTINQNGEVLAQLDGQVAPANLGQITISIFANDAGLSAQGQNLFLETPASGAAASAAPGTAGYGVIEQGWLEGSNVNVVNEITALITAQRAYEMNSRVISTSDEMMSAVNQLR
ncbi:MAG: flagellar basal-body rod protein FlgG [Alphaproteobacteria bacterium]